MVLSDFLTETRRKWLKAFKLFKKSHSRRNKVSPSLVRSPSFSGTVDASAEIDVRRFCACRASLPAAAAAHDDTAYGSYASYDSSCHSLQSVSEFRSSDSAYDSARSTPSHAPQPRYAAVSYFQSTRADSEDTRSVGTEYTLLEADERDHEVAQNLLNESLELVSSL